jgi:branched-chain amino acid transport system permease protein
VDVQLFFQQVLNGIQAGCIYGALALALVLIFRSTSLLNFAQGEMAMFSTFLALVLFDDGWPIVVAVGAAMVVALVGGGIIERALIRPIGGDSHLAIVIVTVGLFIAFNALAGWIYGNEGEDFPRLFGNDVLASPGGVDITRETVSMLVILLAVVGLLYLLFQFTKVGLAMRAVASNQESSSLCGVRVGRMLMLGWGLSAAVGALAGVLAASADGNINLNLLQPILIYAFAAATLGGFDSPLGAVVGGLIVGVTEALTFQYLDLFDGMELASAFLLILIVLLVRPQGLFGRRVVHRV